MFWIYIPPIIFISALIFLVIILGRKTALLRKRELASLPVESPSNSLKKSERWKTFQAFVLKFLEKTIHLIKIGIKRSEEGLSKILHRVKEKRLGRKLPKTLSEEKDSLVYLESKDVVLDMDLAKSKKSQDSASKIKAERIFSQEVIVRKKEEPLPQRIVPELAAEDKAKEDALIHRIAENPKDNEAYRELGEYYLSVGNIKDAKESFKMVLKLRPRDLKAKSSLREIEMRMRLGN